MKFMVPVCVLVRNLMDKTGASPSCVEAIGVDSQMAGIMGIDKEEKHPPVMIPGWIHAAAAT